MQDTTPKLRTVAMFLINMASVRTFDVILGTFIANRIIVSHMTSKLRTVAMFLILELQRSYHTWNIGAIFLIWGGGVILLAIFEVLTAVTTT
jgi:hypothetical protein